MKEGKEGDSVNNIVKSLMLDVFLVMEANKTGKSVDFLENQEELCEMRRALSDDVRIALFDNSLKDLERSMDVNGLKKSVCL